MAGMMVTFYQCLIDVLDTGSLGTSSALNARSRMNACQSCLSAQKLWKRPADVLLSPGCIASSEDAEVQHSQLTQGAKSTAEKKQLSSSLIPNPNTRIMFWM